MIELRGFLPPSPFLQAILRRGAIAWLVLRLGLAVLALLGRQTGIGTEPVIVVDPITAFLIIAVATFLVMIDVRVAREHILLANLGVPYAGAVMAAASAPLALELLTYLYLPLRALSVN